MNLTLTDNQVEAIEALHSPTYAKHFRDPQQWVTPHALGWCIDLGMNRGNQKLWCLDIGSRVPYFAWVAAKYNHDVLSVDVRSDALVTASRVLNCEFIPHNLFTSKRLPRLPHRFDLITMFGVSLPVPFEEYGRSVRTAFDQLIPGGRLVVGPNLGYLDNVWQHLAKWQAFIPGKLATIEKRNNWIIFQSR